MAGGGDPSTMIFYRAEAGEFMSQVGLIFFSETLGGVRWWGRFVVLLQKSVSLGISKVCGVREHFVSRLAFEQFKSKDGFPTLRTTEMGYNAIDWHSLHVSVLQDEESQVQSALPLMHHVGRS